MKWALVVLLAAFSLSIFSDCVSAEEETAAPKHSKVKAKDRQELPLADPRGAAELSICSQNLQNLGTYAQSKSRLFNITADEFQEKQEALVARFKRVDCDVIAVQELLGKNVEQAEEVLRKLVAKLQRKTNRHYEVSVGETNESLSRVGFIVAKDRAEIANRLSYQKVELPKITAKEKPRLFIRAPYEIQLLVKPRGESPGKTVSLVNFHFKSKAGKERDPTDLEWETYRMQMAEALRRVVERRHAASFASGETIFVTLGDRNSNFDAASARILEGALVMRQFQNDPQCRLSQRGVPICKNDSFHPQRLFSVITGDPELKLQQGTYQFEGSYSFIDDILMPAESLRTAWKNFDREGEFDAGIIRDPKEASDHAMVYVRLNW